MPTPPKRRPMRHPWMAFMAISTLMPLGAGAQPTEQSTVPATAPPGAGEQLRVFWLERSSAGSGFPIVQHATVEFVGIDQGHFLGKYRRGLYVIDTDAIRSVQRRIGTKPASAPAMVAGSAGGFVAAFLAAALTSRSGGDAVNAGLSAGVLVGAPLGALVAWIASRSRGIYEQVPIPSS